MLPRITPVKSSAWTNFLVTSTLPNALQAFIKTHLLTIDQKKGVLYKIINQIFCEQTRIAFLDEYRSTADLLRRFPDFASLSLLLEFIEWKSTPSLIGEEYFNYAIRLLEQEPKLSKSVTMTLLSTAITTGYLLDFNEANCQLFKCHGLITSLEEIAYRYSQSKACPTPRLHYALVMRLRSVGEREHDEVSAAKRTRFEQFASNPSGLFTGEAAAADASLDLSQSPVALR
jgi:hypothetical protein